LHQSFDLILKVILPIFHEVGQLVQSKISGRAILHDRVLLPKNSKVWKGDIRFGVESLNYVDDKR